MQRDDWDGVYEEQTNVRPRGKKNGKRTLSPEEEESLGNSREPEPSEQFTRPDDPPGVNDDNRGNVIVPGAEGSEPVRDVDGNRKRGRNAPLEQDDPYYQFGVPVEYWGVGRDGQARSPGTIDVGGLSPDDPFWQFGTPPEMWGQARKTTGNPNGNTGRPRRGGGGQGGGGQGGGGQGGGGRGGGGQGGGGQGGGGHSSARPFIECRHCGVKIERKRQHQGNRNRCPQCGAQMR